MPLINALAVLIILGLGQSLRAGIHRAPIIIPGYKIKLATRYPIQSYRIFRTGPKAEAQPIPFQIDEITQEGDFVLDQGPLPNQNLGNQIFNAQDELAIMGDDVGPAEPPKSWPNNQKPTHVFEVRFQNRSSVDPKGVGAIYIGIYVDTKPPPTLDSKYVIFDVNSGSVRTSRYRYDFDRKNYLVVNGVDMLKNFQPDGKADATPLIQSSTFYLKADLKYFLTFTANHRLVDSKLEAFKTGPIRTLVRVSFTYTILKLNFSLGMYTEVSFFSNSVILPAIMYNPINGKKSLNRGSGFYYGFTLVDNPYQFQSETNMETFRPESGLLGSLMGKSINKQNLYWLSMMGTDRMLYLEVSPSKKMLEDENIPFLYMKDAKGQDLKSIKNDDPLALAQSPVNVGLYFDLTKFTEGEHLMALKLYFENKADKAQLDSFKNLNDWYFRLTRL